MIHLITFNPAIDTFISSSTFVENETNIYQDQVKRFGGKAINSSKIISQYTSDYTLVTIYDKQNLDFIESELVGINTHLIKSDFVRTNYKINVLGNVTEFNKSAKAMSDETRAHFKAYFENQIKPHDIVVVSGSMAKLDIEFLKDSRSLFGKCQFVLDSASVSLEDLKILKPDVIKPNVEELLLITGTLDIEDASSLLLKQGIDTLLISLGGLGSKYVTLSDQLVVSIAPGVLIDAVGAGDSYLAGYVLGLFYNYSTEDCLKLASACGSATAYSKSIAKRSLIDSLLSEVNVG